ncbi:sec-independent protein translocase protein TatC [Virgibacillus subterraneus]|uniref:Sec-independent protein translocase protein TatC n=2 Tax=Virgibacillus TaxID=84406 RepID=A0A1H1BVB0_9BACI|nr:MULTISPECIES: twin-arginine translocase subunit TatC [Virgibacillus]SDQ55855.1 sec-independent protein translocase protein TatC [Virgibacillus salinus]SEQ27872.1 sec-independent protein translocase protein TatC [Virgibacillus subterraneus]
MSEEQQFENEKEMNLVGHLSELRNRLIVTAVVFITLFVIGFIYVESIYYFFTKDLDFTLKITGLTDTVSVYITLAGLVAIIGTLPLLCLQIWLFIRPGLTKTEQRASLLYIPAIFLLFIGGLVFGYIIFVNLIIPFLLSLNTGMFDEIFTYDRYFKLLFRITIPFALLFEIPILSMFLTSLGILTPEFMRKTRKYAYLILVIVGAIITPPDFVLQIVVAIPLIVLYEISIYLSGIVYRKKIKKHQEFMENNEV